MPLPPKGWFRVAEIAKSWDVAQTDVEDYALEGLLEVSVYVVGAPAEQGLLEPDDRGGLVALLEGRMALNGPQPLRRSSLLQIVREGQAPVWQFHAGEGRYLQLLDRDNPLCVRRQDLIVTREERERFEREYRLEAAQAVAAAGPGEPRAETLLHQESDFRVVHLGDRQWQLGPMQAGVVRQLHEAWRNGRHWIAGKTLLSEAGANSLRMRDLFKGHVDWRTLIVSDGRGNYRLNLPPQRVRLFRRLWQARPDRGGRRVAAMTA